MKKFQTTIIIVGIIIAGFILNFHIIRLNDGFEVITKDNMGLRETYVDARNLKIAQLLIYTPRVRNYLIYRVCYTQTYDEMMKKTDESVKVLKENLRKTEQAVHEWLAEKLH
jgi:predicted ribosome quality control (RQC) complex YloA/Tae2 family protein